MIKKRKVILKMEREMGKWKIKNGKRKENQYWKWKQY